MEGDEFGDDDAYAELMKISRAEIGLIELLKHEKF